MRDARILVAARALRGFADGAVSVLLAGYLGALGFTPFQVGPPNVPEFKSRRAQFTTVEWRRIVSPNVVNVVRTHFTRTATLGSTTNSTPGGAQHWTRMPSTSRTWSSRCPSSSSSRYTAPTS